MKIKKVFKKTRFYINVLLIISTILLLYSIIKIGILSIKYLIPIFIGIFIIDLLLLIFLNKKIKLKNNDENEKKKKRKRKILTYILNILFIIIYFILSIVLINISNSMNNLFKNKSTVTYSVIVTKESNYKKINNLNDKIIGFYEEDKYCEKAKKKLNKVIDVDYVGYSTIAELKEALTNGDVDGIMIIPSYLDSDDDEDNKSEIIDNFDKLTKTIYKFKINIDNSKNTKKINLDKGSFIIYISGQDSYDSEVSETSRSDVNMLAVVNIKTKQILLLSIPRDYYIKIKSKGAYDKLTHISLYGSDEAANSIGDLLDISVDYYVKFNFTTFMKAVEYMLPLDVYSDYDFTTSVYDGTISDCYTYSKGYNHITNSKQALQFVRARKNFSDGDRQRGINQMRFLKAVIKKTSSPSVLIKYNQILKSLEGTFLTNIDNESIINIIKYVLNNNGKWTTNIISLDGSDAQRSTYSGGSQLLYVMIPNQETIENAKNAINAVLNGENPDVDIDVSDETDSNDTHSVIKAATNYGSSSSSYNKSKSYTNNETDSNKTSDSSNDTVTNNDNNDTDEDSTIIDDNDSNKNEDIEDDSNEDNVDNGEDNLNDNSNNEENTESNVVNSNIQNNNSYSDILE